jgi:asparagine synthase (glutamine-hydrolysing)
VATGSATRALAGVFAPRTAHAATALAARLELALAPDGTARRLEDGPLALAWTQGGAPGVHVLADGVACVLDGHVYNLAELAGEPVADAASALARLYARHGVDLLPRLRGDFALVLWDRDAGTGLLARDQLGGRPLHVHRMGDSLAFASELRNLARLLPATPAPDEQAFEHWLSTSTHAGDRTLLRGVHTLEPAHYVELSRGGASAPRRYWEPAFRGPAGGDDAVAAVSRALVRAVARRASDAESTAILLSGGIDSAGVAGVAASLPEAERRPRRAYTVTFPRHPEIDEGPLTAAVASAAGLDATSLRLESGSVIGGALPYIEAWLTPPSSPNLFFLRPLLDRAREDGTRVLLDGEGGDAVFWHASVLIGDRLRSGRVAAAWSLAGRLPEYGLPTTTRRRLRELREWGMRQAGPRANEPRWWRFLTDGVVGPGSRLLHDVSRRHAALAGLEPRHPLLDLDLVELVLGLPPELAFDRRFNRPLLRQALDGLVPDDVRLRPYKSRFDPVLADGIVGDLPLAERLLLQDAPELAAYVPRRELEELLRARPADPPALRSWASRVWQLALAECWLRTLSGEPALPSGAHAVVSATAADIGPL